MMTKVGDILFMVNIDNTLTPYSVIWLNHEVAYIICIHGYNQGWYQKGGIELKYISDSHFDIKHFKTKDNGVFQQISSKLKEDYKESYEQFLQKKGLN